MTAAPKALLATILLALPLAANPLSGDDRTPKAVVVSDDGDTVEIETPPAPPALPQIRIRHSGPRLGISIVDITPELRTHFGAPKDAGVLVGGVEKDGPAAKAGVEVGDVVTSVDGEKVENPGELARAIRHKPAGETVVIEVIRNRAARKLTAKLEARPREDAELHGFLGPEFERDLQREIRRGLRDARPFAYGFDMEGDHIRALPPLPPRDLKKLQEKLEDLDKRLKELEGKQTR